MALMIASLKGLPWIAGGFAFWAVLEVLTR